MKESRTELYKEEFDYIFGKKALCVRGALVTSALVEGQVLLLAKLFLEEHRVKYEPEKHQEYRQSLNILKANGILNSEELKNIEKFRKARNRSIHGPFKGMTRKDWERCNNEVVKLGRPILKSLDEKLYS